MNLNLAMQLWGICAAWAIPTLAFTARWVHRTRWRRSLTIMELQPPAALTTDTVAAWLAHLATLTTGRRAALLPRPPICVEITATAGGVRFQVACARELATSLRASVQATIPGTRITEPPNIPPAPPGLRSLRRVAAELTVTSRDRPLATDRATQAATALLAALQPAPAGGEIRVQWLIASAGAPDRVPSVHTRTAPVSRPSRWGRGNEPVDAEAARAARTKRRDPLVAAVARVAVTAATRAQARAVLGRVWPTVRLLDAPSVHVRRRGVPSPVVGRRVVRRCYPLTRWPLVLSSTEAAGWVPLPVGDVVLPGVTVGAARQLPPSTVMPRTGLALGVSNYPGMHARPIALGAEDRLRHQFVLGPTGSGKSWLLARMILHDITAHRGVMVIDPKGDLIPDVLARIPHEHTDRVVVIDAAARDHPIGLNVLGGARTEPERELLADTVLHVFASVWAGSWGPRSDAVCRAALATLVSARGVNGEPLTLCELPVLLTEPGFRRRVLAQASVPAVVRPWWRRYDAMSDPERFQVIAPLLNKVEAFTTRTPIRLMLGQSTGITLRDIFTQQKVVLVSLAKGTLGSETANLLGSLLVSLLWQATLEQITVPAEGRRSCFAYIDEAANLLRLPLPLGDMFAQARGLGLGLVLATQILGQVPSPVRAAFLGTVRTQMTFAVEHDDATLLAHRFTPLSAGELSALAPYEAALRPCIGGITRSPVTLTTVPLDPAVRDPGALAEASRVRYGQPRPDVEAALRNRITPPNPPVGRRTLDGTP